MARNSRQVFIGEKKRRRRIFAAGRPHHVFAKLAACGRRLRRDVAVGTDDLAGLPVEPRPFAEKVPDPDIGERAKCREPRLGFEERRGEAAHVANHGDAVGGHRCCLEADRIGAGEADRFLDEDVLAGPKRRGRMLVMVLVGTEDKDHVDRGIRDQHLDRCMDTRDAPPLADALHDRRRNVCDSRHREPVLEPMKHGKVNELRDLAQPDDPDSQSRHMISSAKAGDLRVIKSAQSRRRPRREQETCGVIGS